MVSTAFISVSFRHRQDLSDVLDTIERVLKQSGVKPHIFVRAYTFTEAQAHEMMQTALRDIAHADLLIAEVTYKAIGIGIEVGYAYAMGKPILYLRHIEAESSTTVGGLSDKMITYTNEMDLQYQLDNALAAYL